jgi:hypothetical protein
MRSFTILLAISTILCLLLPVLASAEVPQLISYQGRLTKPDGDPVANGTYQITFKIYDGPGPSAIVKWNSGPKTVQVTGGLFEYQLGSTTPYLPDDLLSSDTARYLGITVGTGDEITPRVKLASTPYSYHALRADTADVAGGWADDGAIVRLANSDDDVNIGGPGPWSNKLYVESSEGTIGGTTAFIKNTNTSDGMGLMVENSSEALSLLISQQGEHPDGEILRCDSYTGGWKAVHMIMNNGRTVIGTPAVPITNTMLEVQSDSLYAGYFTSNMESNDCHIIHAEYMGGAVLGTEDPVAVFGNSLVGDRGFGGHFIGGSCGVKGEADPTSGENSLYSGVWGTASGELHTKIGVQGEASGSGENRGVAGRATSLEYSAINYGLLGYGYGGGETYGVMGEADHWHISSTCYGVFGSATGPGSNYGLYGSASGATSLDVGVRGEANGTGINYGVSGAALGTTTEAYGVRGSAMGGSGMNYGLSGFANGGADAYGVKAEARGGTFFNYGVYGSGEGGDDLDGTYGVYGSAEGSSVFNIGVGAFASGPGIGIGVDAYSSGSSTANFGVRGYAQGSGENTAIYGRASGGTTNYAGYFEGDVHITGTLTGGKGESLIDHPLDPENKYLYHSFVESPEMMNVYNGNVVLGDNGEAVVRLPEYFDALNKDFRYQLTCIGGFAPVYVAEEITGNRFEIAGGQPGMKVSWQVTGIRKDAYAEANRIQVEADKPAEKKGLYLYPEAYGLGPEKSVDRELRKPAQEKMMN